MKRISRQTFADELEKIVQGLRSFAPQKAILFGSFARGDYHAGSDVDLLIIKDTQQSFVERSAEVLRACSTTLLAIEPLVYTPQELERMIQQENSFVQQAIAEGLVIYEQ